MSRSEDPTQGGRRFRQVAVVFVGLLAVGLVFAFVVYEKYVAYEPTVARHAPSDAGVVLRIDLTHVMFYEPFRRSIMPLVDHGAALEPSRLERLSARGVRLGADVRELLLAVGPGHRDWALVVGGQLPKTGLDATIADILSAEQQPIEVRPDGVRVLSSTGQAFAQAGDGAFVLGSDEARVRAVLPVRAADTALTEGSGGVRVSGARLGSPWRSLTASLRAGSFVAVDLHADFADSSAGPQALTHLLRGAGSVDATLVRPVEDATRVVRQGVPDTVRVDLPKDAVEALARWLGARAVETFAAAPGAT